MFGVGLKKMKETNIFGFLAQTVVWTVVSDTEMEEGGDVDFLRIRKRIKSQ